MHARDNTSVGKETINIQKKYARIDTKKSNIYAMSHTILCLEKDVTIS